jgi:atypical dual specificity phosphatase
VKAGEKRVLVHCVQGMSRSASVVLAYLMSRERKTFKQAWEHVTALRPVVKPNPGFIIQLLELEKILFGETSMSFTDIYPEGTKLLPASTHETLEEV